MSAIDLVARCTTKSCHMSIRFSMCEEKDWELFSNVIRQGKRKHQQCFKIGNSSAMYRNKICLSNVIRQGLRQECFEIGISSAM